MTWLIRKGLFVDFLEDAELAIDEFFSLEGEDGPKCLFADVLTDLCLFVLKH